ncbi:hypothetical protein QW131_23475 [Roseibium salinum]|nr:hypothetical protein [Roseibium salinum]
MAKIGAAHGIRGEVRVKPFGDDPLSFTDYGVLTTKDGRSFEVEKGAGAEDGRGHQVQGDHGPQSGGGTERAGSLCQPRPVART